MGIAVLYQDPFTPTLYNSPPLVVTDEQKLYLREVCSIGASDEQFAQKLYNAILYILTHGNTTPPAVTSLNPASAVIGSPAFDMHVIGTGFNSGSKIFFNGLEEPTTLNSPTDVSTGINMPLWTAPAVVPVTVQNADGTSSQPMDFSFVETAVMSAQKTELKSSLKPVVTVPPVTKVPEQKK
jgi:hypothetical protein